MSALPLQTFASPGNPLFYPVGQEIIVPSIVTSTITAQEIEVSNSSNAGWGVIPTGISSIAETMIAQSNGDLFHFDIKSNNVGSTIQTFAQGIPANNSNYSMVYQIATPTGVSTIGTIGFQSSIGAGVSGGIVLTAQDGTQFSVGNATSGTYGQGGALVTQLANSNVTLGHFVGSSQPNFIDFDHTTSSITLYGGPAYIDIASAGTILSPGSNKSVQLANGYLDINNLAMSNVSSINGADSYVHSYINPYGGTLQVSTIANSTTPVPFGLVSSISTHTYLVQVEFSAVNGGGGAGTDQTNLGLKNYDSNLGPLGRFVQIDTWTPNQSQTPDAYRVSRSCVVQAFADALQLEVANGNGSGNVEIVQVESIFVKDLGVPVNNY